MGESLSLGVYPEVSLKDARERRDEARKLLANGIDPSEHRKAQKAAGADGGGNSFEVVAREWFAKNSPSWSANHADRIIRRFEHDIFPWIGRKPIGNITVPELLSVIHRIENRGALETAHRALGNCSQVFRYAVATGRTERDPTGDLRGALPPARGEHFAAVTDPMAHAVRDPNGRAYNRTAHLPERKNMMQEWADYLDKIKNSAKVIPIHHNA